MKTVVVTGATKTIGIIGGMGPAATIELMSRIVRKTPARDDNDHFRMLVDNNPKVPSRIAAIIEKVGADPVPTLVSMAQGLEAAGAGLLVMPCNTAHYYQDSIARSVRIPFISMVDASANYLSRHFPGARRIGFLASPAVQQTGVYEGALARSGMASVYPDSCIASRILAIIKDVKAGRCDESQRVAVLETAQILAQSSDAILVACTELSIVPMPQLGEVPVLDTLDLLTEATIHAAQQR